MHGRSGERCNYWRMAVSERTTNTLLCSLLLSLHLCVSNCNGVILEPSGVVQLCPGSNLIFTCSAGESSLLAWRADTIANTGNNWRVFTYLSSIGADPVSVGSFAVWVVHVETNPIVSRATLTNSFDLSQNGTTLFCTTTKASTVKEDQVAQVTLTLDDLPAPLQPAMFQDCYTSAVLSWIPANESTCITMYTITLINISMGNTSYTYNTTTNTTSMTVSDLTQGAEYSFTVAGVDAEGRVGEESVPSQAVRLTNLSPLQPAISPKSFTSSVLTWTPSTGLTCVTHVFYTVTLINVSEGTSSYTYNTTTNTTIMTVKNLTRGLEYLFTVAGVDAQGSVGEESVPSQSIKLDTPEAVTNLHYQHRFCDDALVKVTVEWMPPPQSSIPPVIGYSVSHNATGNVEMNMTNSTQFLMNISPLEEVVFTVSAVNVLGVGAESSVTIYVSDPVTTSMAETPTDDWHIAVLVCGALLGGCVIISLSGVVILSLRKKSVSAASRPTESNAMNDQRYDIPNVRINEHGWELQTCSKSHKDMDELGSFDDESLYVSMANDDYVRKRCEGRQSCWGDGRPHHGISFTEPISVVFLLTCMSYIAQKPCCTPAWQ